MDISSILLALVVLLAAAAISVLLFERLGFGAILGFHRCRDHRRTPCSRPRAGACG